ncbi:type II toxin-antitoxin system HipA family toxin [Mesorhizobium sp. YC-39]|uniref:type II toxin-antitoxin system HipA family toxin n=1 Tax=unclassified Mesorhizobium TaxID=325217 RepID=UPI0021E735BF|nr:MULTISPECIES: type II toxin-antitoxin system HipA family toxin [unclassified Mesorhizobium]MCV3210984.1 type II toxin-antitoxin system HipA family toxin [Mesorhizobium sp. YC-2]MCV3232709.1 type II toxin-antitoxin system HipA family toxin [Mesorhizobium sp. YC-39]
MARRPAHVPLNVFLNGRLVGVLRRESTGAIDFQYARQWLDWRSTFPVSLSLPLREDRYIGAPVINVFDNLLPDNDAIRRRIAERVNADGTDAYSMLSVLGHDCVGALQFLSDGIDPGPVGLSDGKRISDDDVAEMINNLAAAPLGLGEDEDFRISIAGAQEKTALLRKDGHWFKPIGTSATTHILKPQIGRLPNGIDLTNSVENEYLCLKLLEAFGIPAAKSEIADFGERRTLIVERFDRLWARDGRLLRLPQEDCCQALSIPPTRKYQTGGGPGLRAIVDLLKGSDTPNEDIMTFMRANIIFWLIGATDGHAKNFSIFLTPGGRYRLTPLYDVLTAQPSLDTGEVSRKKFKLAMSIGKSRHYAIQDIMPRHFMQTADLAGIGKPMMKALFEDLAIGVELRIAALAESLPRGFPPALVDSVTAALRHRARFLVEEGEAT